MRGLPAGAASAELVDTAAPPPIPRPPRVRCARAPRHLAIAAFGVVLIAVRDAGERAAAVALMVISFALLAAAVTWLRRPDRPPG